MKWGGRSHPHPPRYSMRVQRGHHIQNVIQRKIFRKIRWLSPPPYRPWATPPCFLGGIAGWRDGWMPGPAETMADEGTGQTTKTPYLTAYPVYGSISHQMRKGDGNGACGGKAGRVTGATVSRGRRGRLAGLAYRYPIALCQVHGECVRYEGDCIKGSGHRLSQQSAIMGVTCAGLGYNPGNRRTTARPPVVRDRTPFLFPLL